jgi:uncharacterized protein (TIGR03000 family)
MQQSGKLVPVFLILGVATIAHSYWNHVGLKLGGLGAALEGWREYEPAGGGFAVDMPAEPTVTSETRQVLWLTVEMQMHTARLGRTAYLVGRADYPPHMAGPLNTDVAFAAARDAAARSVQGRVVSEAPSSRPDLAGREGRIAVPGKGSIDYRIYLAGSRLYVLSAAWEEGACCDADNARFFDTFRVLPAAAAPPPAPRPAAPPPPAERPVLLTIHVPADARVNIEGVTVAGTGPVRQFRSPPLQPGRDYGYTVSAAWVEDGRPVVRTRQVSVFAGQQALVSFLER